MSNKMWKAWVENDAVFVTADDTLVLQNYIEVPEGTTPQDLKIVDGKLVLKTEEEKIEELRQAKLQELRQYVYSLLSQTDWVVTKLQSLRFEGVPEDVIEQETKKYASILEKRQKIRAWNEETERAILEAKTVEELQAIKIEFKE